MTTWFVTRHIGAVEGAAQPGLVVNQQAAQLDVDEITAGGFVIGPLPVLLAAKGYARGAHIFNLSRPIGRPGLAALRRRS